MKISGFKKTLDLLMVLCMTLMLSACKSSAVVVKKNCNRNIHKEAVKQVARKAQAIIEPSEPARE